MAVELRTVTISLNPKPNASRNPLRNFRFFYLGVNMNTMKNNSGFTIIEVMVSVGIMLVFLPFAASMLTNSQLLASYSKHKIQAAYAAQQIIETQRQKPFVIVLPGFPQTIGPNSVILDTKGNYSNPTCANSNVFCGNSTITITPAQYTSTSGVKTNSPYVDHYVVAITWVESFNVLNVIKQVPFTEYYAEDIANDPMLN